MTSQLVWSGAQQHLCWVVVARQVKLLARAAVSETCLGLETPPPSSVMGLLSFTGPCGTAPPKEGMRERDHLLKAAVFL